MKFSILEIQTVFHYYCSPEPHPREKDPAILMIIDEMIDRGIFSTVEVKKSGASDYAITELGNAWVQLILSTPIPSYCYMDPRTSTIISQSRDSSATAREQPTKSKN